MSRRPCFLVELAAGTSADEAAAHLVALREALGPDAGIDLAWTGDFAAERPAGVRVLRRGGAPAVAAAAARGAGSAPLVVLLGTTLPDPAAIQGVVEALDLDPMIGFAQPRFGDPDGQGVWSLPDRDAAPALLPRSALPLLPRHYLTPERLSACVAIRGDVAATFAPALGEVPGGVRPALVELLCRARRCGYRTAVVNRVVVPSSEPHDLLYPRLDRAAEDALHATFPDARTAEERFSTGPHLRFERVAARARRRTAADRLPVLLDCRGAQARHNGTSAAILGLVDGLVEAAPRWSADLLCDGRAVEYHDLARRYPGLGVVTRLPEAAYAAAVRLDQPWHLSTVAELHRRAHAVAFNMLDTIAWDVVYLASPDVETTWSFIGEHADGLMFNSEYTQRRFAFRFAPGPSVAQAVTFHSVDPAEYRDERVAALPEGEHVLVFGNAYDHKAVGPTLDLLGQAFPFQAFRGVGASGGDRHNVETVPSGGLPGEEIDRLVATARLVVFPSHYEGFGLPVVQALSYGRTVVVRASPLWKELARSVRGPGRLVEFAAPHELVAAVGKALAGEPLEGLPFGAAGAAPARWADCAARMVSLVEGLVAGGASRWHARERALSLAGL